MSRHVPSQKLALEFGATDIVEERGDGGVAKIKELTGGLGAYSVIEVVAPGVDDSATRSDSMPTAHAFERANYSLG